MPKTTYWGHIFNERFCQPCHNYAKSLTYFLSKYFRCLFSLTCLTCHIQGWIQGGGRGGQPPPPPPPPTQKINLKMECLKGKGRIISLFLHQKCLNVNSSGHKEPQNRNFLTISCLLMPIVMIVSRDENSSRPSAKIHLPMILELQYCWSAK